MDLKFSLEWEKREQKKKALLAVQANTPFVIACTSCIHVISTWLFKNTTQIEALSQWFVFGPTQEHEVSPLPGRVSYRLTAGSTTGKGEEQFIR